MNVLRTILSILLMTAFVLAQEVYINELDYDQVDTDSAEFIELIGTSGASLNGYTIEFVNGNNGSVYRTVDLTGQTIPADDVSGFGFFVIGVATIANVDFTPADWPATNSIQNGAQDGVVLKLAGNVIDGFSYEGVLSGNTDFTAGMEITAADNNTSDNTSIGRISNGFDNTNQDQFFAQAIATSSPGEINAAHGQILGGDPLPTISNINTVPAVPTADESLVVSADINDDSAVDVALVQFIINDGAIQTATMTLGTGSNYSATIDAANYTDGDRLEYWIYAEDDAPQSNQSDTLGVFTGTTDIVALLVNDDDGALVYDGYGARISGTATVSTGVFSTTNIDVYLQDNSGGINIFQFGLDSTVSILQDNDYTIVGELDQFNGKSELIPADPANDIIDNGAGSAVAPVTATIGDLLADPETYEGQLVEILQVSNTEAGDTWPDTLGSFSRNIEITDGGSAVVLTMRIDSDTDIIGTPEPNWPVDVRGIFSQFDNVSPFDEGYQLLPRGLGDIDTPTAIEPISSDAINSFQLYSNYPNPFNPETTLRFDVPQTSETVVLDIYNVLGQKVRSLVNERLNSGSYEVQWSGVNEQGQAVASGLYYAVLSGESFRQTIRMVYLK